MVKIVTTANAAYFPGVVVAVASLLARGGFSEAISFHVLDTGLEEWQREVLRSLTGEVKFHWVDQSLFGGWLPDYGGGHSTYARLLMGEVLGGGKAIYVDADVLVRERIDHLLSGPWPTDVLVQATREHHADGKPATLDYDCPFAPATEVAGYPYFNCGLMVVDIDGWHREKIAARALEAAKGHEGKLKAWDQTILNYVLRGRIEALPPSTFRAADWRPPGDTRIWHYISPRKPWNSYTPSKAYAEWYEFSRRHLRHLGPAGPPAAEFLRGWARTLRDQLLFRCPPLAAVYLRDLERREGVVHSRAYEEYLRARRERRTIPRELDPPSPGAPI